MAIFCKTDALYIQGENYFMVELGNIRGNTVFFPKNITPDWKCKIKIFDKGTYSEKNPYIIDMDSQKVKSVKGVLPLTSNFAKFSLFNIIAGMDGKADDITMSDLAKLKKQFKDDDKNTMLKTLGVTNVKWDGNAGKGTIEFNYNEVVVIDFETASESSNKKTLNSKTTKNNVSQDMDYDGFIQDLALSESSGDYKAVNRLGYIGRYQFGETALKDIGMYEESGGNVDGNNDWKGTFIIPNKYGKTIRTKNKNAFLNSSAAQETAMEKYMKKQWEYIKSFGINKYVGKKYKGFTITESGLIAAAHLRGAKRLSEFFNELSQFKTIKNMKPYRDANGKSVIDYMRDFAGYDVKEITQAKS